jgi:DNA-directed RNA polymerase subunit omega
MTFCAGKIRAAQFKPAGFYCFNQLAGERIGRAGCRQSRYTSYSEGGVCRIVNLVRNIGPPTRETLHPIFSTMRDDYLQKALKTIDDPYILVNVVSRRVKQLRRGARALVESLEKLAPEDIALREIIEGKISYELGTPDVSEPWRPPVRSRSA